MMWWIIGAAVVVILAWANWPSEEQDILDYYNDGAGRHRRYFP